MAMSKPDQRGQHWKAKVEQGKGPTPWKKTQDWARQRRTMEDEFRAFLQDHNIRYTLPWNTLIGCDHNTGNSTKALFIHLKLMSFKKELVLTISDTTDSFYGITKIEIPVEHRKTFDEGPFPTPSSLKFTDPHRKAVMKYWSTAGLQEIGPNENNSVEFIYSSELFERIKKQHKHSDLKDKGASKGTSAASAAIPTGSGSGSAQVATLAGANPVPVRALGAVVHPPSGVPIPAIHYYNMPYVTMNHAQPSMMRVGAPAVLPYSQPGIAPVPALGSFVPPGAPVLAQPRVASDTTSMNLLSDVAEEERNKMAKRQKLQENIQNAREAIRKLEESIRNDERALAQLD